MFTYSVATKADIVAFYGSVRETLRVICAKRDGVPVGFVGIAIGPHDARFFSEHRGLSCKEMCQCYRAVKMAMKYVKESRRPVISIAEHEQGHKNLKRLGFKHVDGDLYVWVQDPLHGVQ